MNAKVIFYCRYCEVLTHKCRNHRWGMLVAIPVTPDFTFVFGHGEIELEKFVETPNAITGEVKKPKSSGAIEFEKAYHTTGGWYSIYPQVVETAQLNALNLTFRFPTKNERIFIKKLLFDESNTVEFAKVLSSFYSLPEELEHIEEYIFIYKRDKVYSFKDFKIIDIPCSYKAQLIFSSTTIEIPKVSVYRNHFNEENFIKGNYTISFKIATDTYEYVTISKRDDNLIATFYNKKITISKPNPF